LGNTHSNFHLHRFTTSENIAKSFRGGGYFFDSHCTHHRLRTSERVVSTECCTLHSTHNLSFRRWAYWFIYLWWRAAGHWHITHEPYNNNSKIYTGYKDEQAYNAS